jgi:hypothetical protein
MTLWQAAISAQRGDDPADPLDAPERLVVRQVRAASRPTKHSRINGAAGVVRLGGPAPLVANGLQAACRRARPSRSCTGLGDAADLREADG